MDICTRSAIPLPSMVIASFDAAFAAAKLTRHHTTADRRAADLLPMICSNAVAGLAPLARRTNHDVDSLAAQDDEFIRGD